MAIPIDRPMRPITFTMPQCSALSQGKELDCIASLKYDRAERANALKGSAELDPACPCPDCMLVRIAHDAVVRGDGKGVHPAFGDGNCGGRANERLSASKYARFVPGS